jgi:hypothetical protein
MKAITPIAAGLALALALPAHAQVNCSDLKKVLTEGRAEFVGITGDEIGEAGSDEPSVYKSTLSLRGAGECAIYMDNDAIFECVRDIPSERTAKAAYDAGLGGMKSCLVGWEADALDAPEPSANRKRLAGTYFSGAGDFAGMAIEYYLDWADLPAGAGHKLVASITKF